MPIWACGSGPRASNPGPRPPNHILFCLFQFRAIGDNVERIMLDPRAPTAGDETTTKLHDFKYAILTEVIAFNGIRNLNLLAGCIRVTKRSVMIKIL